MNELRRVCEDAESQTRYSACLALLHHTEVARMLCQANGAELQLQRNPIWDQGVRAGDDVAGALNIEV